MLEMVNSLLEWKYWDAILSILVIIHLISEYGHYIWEFVSGRRESNILKDIQIHLALLNILLWPWHYLLPILLRKLLTFLSKP